MEDKNGHVKPPKKNDQDLGFVPLITARNLAGRQKNVKSRLREVLHNDHTAKLKGLCEKKNLDKKLDI